MDTNYPLEIVIGLLVLLGLVYLAEHQAPGRSTPGRQTIVQVAPSTVPTPDGR
ncbi:MAG: hypothetical protein M1472_01630 [Planctomycetes bacterium]|jgi:hypothetical protein|nr:hypothetical protein [Planctomycetota bacterium]